METSSQFGVSSPMPSVYIETSIVSYLTARPSQSLLVAAWQDVTVTWWSYHRQDFDLCTSALVIEEASRGDQEAAGRRIAHLEGIPLLPVSDQVIEFARRLVHPGPLPVEAADDAFHVALSAVHAVDYLLTWNFKHIDNALIKPQFRAICLKHGYPSPEICTPQEMVGGLPDER